MEPQLASAQRGVVDTQLIAHDKEVYDIAWGGVGVFASVSADGSVRVFDLRCGAVVWVTNFLTNSKLAEAAWLASHNQTDEPAELRVTASEAFTVCKPACCSMQG